MDEQLTKVHKDIYAIVASVQGGCQASKILHEYRQNYGMLDFRKFGHKNLNEFLATVPKIFVSRNAIGETLYKAKLADSEAARDIQFQVSMQKAPDRVKTQNFKRSHSTRGQLPQTFQRQTRQRSSYGAAFATQSSHDNQNRTLHGFKKDYVSSWVRTSTPIEDPNGQKPIPLLDEVSTYNRIHNGFVQDRNFAPQLYPRQLPSFKQNYDNRSVQHSHSTWSNHSGRFSQHSQQDLGEKSRNNSNPYRQKANQAAAAAVPQTEAPRVSKTSQLLQDKEIKAECETLSITSGRSSPKGVALFNWGKKSKQEIPETPETPETPKTALFDFVHSFSQMSLNERSSSQGVNKSQRCNESTEIKYDPVSSTLNVDGLTSRIDGATTPLVDYSFSDDSFSEEKIVSSSLSVENIDKRKSLETTQITTTTSVMNDEKAEQVMIDLQRSMENEPQSLQNLAAQHEQNLAAQHEQNLAAQQVIGDLQENKKNEPKAQNLAVQKAQDRQAKAHERWKTKIAAIIRKAVTDLGSTQQNHTPGNVKQSIVVSPLVMKKALDLVDERRSKQDSLLDMKRRADQKNK